MSLTSPAPGATESRTDQGKDWSNVKRIVAVGAGKITDVLNLQGFGTTIIEKLTQSSDQYGPYVYYGEESGGGTPEVHAGQDVQQGQEIAGGTGGVIEAGWWDPSTGRSKGAPGFSESNPSTAAGRDFFAAVSGKQSPTITRPGGAGSGGGQDSSAALDSIFAAYQAEVAMPRKAPPQSGFTPAKQAGWKAPFQWWLQSFTDKWLTDLGAGGAAAAAGATGGGGAPPSAAGFGAPRRVAATMFGGPGDPGTGSTGYKGDDLNQKPDSFAELSMGTALGNLPYMTPIELTGPNGQTMTLYKRDIGGGGPGVGGVPRAVDVWYQSGQKLGLTGLDVVTIRIGKA